MIEEKLKISSLLENANRNSKTEEISFVLEYTGNYAILNEVAIAFLMDCICLLAAGEEKALYYSFVSGN
ncbi:Hypothetical predicted protein [Octopus vulgaris]|uniref:Uncharacterized protein n=1 Tax=Octopus vulgaris TaxID=6645 RepID=A0AA36B307_OCTVU|nr:Hypothetical predicted protein [Octopus vulgaris]